MQSFDKYDLLFERDNLGRALRWLSGLAPIIGLIVAAVSVLHGFRRRAAQGLILSIAGAIWWYLILFVRRLGVPGLFPGALVVLALLVTPLILVSFLRRASWPDSERGDEGAWRRHVCLGVSALFLLSTLLFAMLWFSVWRPQRITWGNSSMFETVEIDSHHRGADQLLLAGYWCLGDIDIELLGFRVLFSDRFDCLWNIKIPFWFLTLSSLVVAVAMFIAKDRSLTELFGKPASSKQEPVT